MAREKKKYGNLLKSTTMVPPIAVGAKVTQEKWDAIFGKKEDKKDGDNEQGRKEVS